LPELLEYLSACEALEVYGWDLVMVLKDDKMRSKRYRIFGAILFLSVGCQGEGMKNRTFGEDVEFLKKHTDVFTLSDETGESQVAVVPAYQGRIMTSTAEGAEGLSFGWLNYELISSGEIQKHINVFGGEDRIWFGPEGGQYSIFFAAGDPFDLEHWYTPAVIDTEPFESFCKEKDRATFEKRTKLTNMAGFTFEIEIERKIRLLDRGQVEDHLGVEVPEGVKVVGYQSENTLKNAGSEAWRKETGLLSIWILGMFNPSEGTTIVIPFEEGPEEQLGAKVNDTYFGKVPAERLIVKDDVLFFSGDGKCRSKIGLSPQRAKPIMGSYDSSNNVLTLVQYSKPEGVSDYVNSLWEMQEEPYRGDAVNSYNDGPPAPGKKPLGPFCELESSSPAAGLEAGESITHIHRTIHLQGPESLLGEVSVKTLGVSLKEVKAAL